MEATRKQYEDWLELRTNSKDKYGEKLCYCGHTSKCKCADPDFKTFQESVERGTIILGDPDNGWKKHEPQAKAIFKFNNGNGALLCSSCRTIMKTLYDMTDKEKKGVKDGTLEPQFCPKCKKMIKSILKPGPVITNT